MTTTEISDEELIRSGRSGDAAALEALYSRHHDAGLRYARRLMANTADAEDVAQEAFLKVAAAMERGKGPEEMFRPYLLRTVRTVATDRWNQQAKETPVDSTGDTPVEDASLEAVLHRNDPGLALRAFQSLPPRWMTVLWHAEVEKEPPRRIAPILGMEPGAVSALLVRARKGLREAYLSAYAATPPRPECEPTFPFLAATVLGTGAARDRRKAKEHTRDCEDCAKVLAELTHVGATMRGVLAPLFLVPLLPAGAAVSGGTAVLLPGPRLWPPAPGMTTALVATCVAVAAVAGGFSLAGNTSPAPAVPATQPAVPPSDASQDGPAREAPPRSTPSPSPPKSPVVPVPAVSSASYPTAETTPVVDSPAATAPSSTTTPSPASTASATPTQPPAPPPTATPAPAPTSARPPCNDVLFFCMPRISPPPQR
ncbi:hypothetical protein BIU82_16035 [Arthrobacter sp. SW1]|uniref:RNA polymerase sigma factor n=1 Tax=Arthrobacter sp. SW1 TaxID=1920889 RepID=UPI000877D624|nr:sigma-70 family RNA polymerase sigma factor [Arthrobacter sp. SW1]OFI39147.1 hypothetical protein BIU82_16035 [Arthrobacter sp. SW1]